MQNLFVRRDGLLFFGRCLRFDRTLQRVVDERLQLQCLRLGDVSFFWPIEIGILAVTQLERDVVHIVQITVDDLRVDYNPADVCPQGQRCSVAVPLDTMPVDHANQSPDMTPGERFHPRRGDKVYIWR